MRTAIITLSLLCFTASAQVFNKTESGNLLWQDMYKNQIILVPSTVIPTPLEGVRLYRDSDTGDSGTITDIGGGQYLVSKQGETNNLTIVSKNPDGSLSWK